MALTNGNSSGPTFFGGFSLGAILQAVTILGIGWLGSEVVSVGRQQVRLEVQFEATRVLIAEMGDDRWRRTEHNAYAATIDRELARLEADLQSLEAGVERRFADVATGMRRLRGEFGNGGGVPRHHPSSSGARE